ncbi:MAG TPA: GAF domain-containing protein [Pyrinomonadaceae bacterium]|jgi:GAF domain-containing protein
MGREIRQRDAVLLSAAANALGTVALGLAGWYGWSDYTRTAVALLVSGVLLLTVGPLVTALFQIKSEAQRERVRTLEALARMVHRVLSKMNMNKADDLRVTLFRVNRRHNPPRLEQVARWANDGAHDPGTFSMSVDQGLAGQCYREEGATWANYTDSDFIQGMLELGFSDTEAKQRKRRGAYLCVPVTFRGEVLAVLSLDAKAPKAFDGQKVELVESLSSPFAEFLPRPERSEN